MERCLQTSCAWIAPDCDVTIECNKCCVATKHLDRLWNVGGAVPSSFQSPGGLVTRPVVKFLYFIQYFQAYFVMVLWMCYHQPNLSLYQEFWDIERYVPRESGGEYFLSSSSIPSAIVIVVSE